ncbi:hypothetical protein BegalDRAFT_2451 [Beggiatoa alba B18LD]|uniref:ATP-binding protein n=1 Tax=Beggiatoa alba B18LD TaxID=395493 RepID=I3CI58_9GAMM|nr:hypothetical protein [Beggiatoa alba]EIJ43301.1 hypothetical protein BegalDRAFT_2451 [Beggiatoa alba B18LD]
MLLFLQRITHTPNNTMPFTTKYPTLLIRQLYRQMMIDSATQRGGNGKLVNSNDAQFTERLNQQPELKKQVIALLDLIENNLSGDTILKDAINSALTLMQDTLKEEYSLRMVDSMTKDKQLPILHVPSKAHRIFGDFTFEPTADREYLELGFSPSSVPLRQRWRNNGLSASFLGDYLTTFFPTNDANPSSVKRRKKIKGAVTYIANELLENAMKFSIEGSHLPVSIHLQLHSDRIVFYVTNSVIPGTLEKFYQFIEELRSSDPQELYVQQVERNMEDEEGGSSGLGLLTMMNDYGANVAWRFDTIQLEPEEVMVTTMVQLIV